MKYTVGGVDYGVTEGRFRGRWWNYYERGRSFLEGGFYEEAQRDLEAALAGRSQDQLWPRTYGMHFIPEYFPRRELGIVKFYKGDFDAAVEELNASIAQQYSARAAYYLDETRKRQLALLGTDRDAPEIEVHSPGRGEAVGTREVEIKGIARDDQFVSRINVNGIPFDIKLSAPKVSFAVRVPLDRNESTVQVSCADLTGKKTTLQIPVTLDLDGPVISFNQPLVVPGDISGVAQDKSGVTSLSIAGKSIDLHAQGGIVPFAVTLAPSDFGAPLTYSCVDALGNTTEGTLPAALVADLGSIPAVIPASDAVSVIPLSSGQRALWMDGRMIALSAAPRAAGRPDVKITNIEDGQHYFINDAGELAVNIQVQSSQVITGLTLDGAPIGILPARKSFMVSHRVSLQEGERQLLAQATDSENLTGEDKKRVYGELNETSFKENKLAIGFVREANVSENPQVASVTDFAIAQLIGNDEIRKRFTIVDRDNTGRLLSELRLSALMAGSSRALALDQFVPADLLVSASAHLDAESVDLVLRATSTETEVYVATRIDAAGPIGDLEAVVDNLALRLCQEFPRVEGEVLRWEAPKAWFDLTEEQRIRTHFKCIVFKSKEFTHPKTGQPMGEQHTVLGEGFVRTVDEFKSSADIRSKLEGTPTEELAISYGDKVIIK